MKILIIQTPHYDYCAATLIEGLRPISFVGMDHLVKCTEFSNYAKTEEWDLTIPHEDVSSFAEEADMIVITSNSGVRSDLIDQDKYRDKLVYIDGSDLPHLDKNPSDFFLYFKREKIKGKDYESNVYPFPFAIEDRYQCMYNCLDKDIPVSCMFGPHDSLKPWRSNIESALNRVKGNDWQIGPVYGEESNIIDTGSRSHNSYFEVLARSQISVDGYGAYGCNAARFWESIANACCLVTQTVRIDMPRPFTSDQIVEFNVNMELTPDKRGNELIEKVQWLLKNPDVVKKMRFDALTHAMIWHTTDARAEYLIDTFRKEKKM